MLELPSTQNFQVGMLTWRAGMALVLTSVCTFEATSSAFFAASGLGNTGAGFFDVAAAAGVVSMSAAPCASSAVMLLHCVPLEIPISRRSGRRWELRVAYITHWAFLGASIEQ